MAIDFLPAERTVVSTEVNTFLINLSVAMHRRAMYPGDHPSIGPALAALTNHAVQVLQHRMHLSIGVASDHLVIDGASTDTDQPLLRALAQRLTRHHVSGLTMSAGLESWELAGLVDRLIVDPDAGEASEVRLGHPIAGQPSPWPHLRISPLQFDPLQLGDGSAGRPTDLIRVLWIELASAVLNRAVDASDPALEDAPGLARTLRLRSLDDTSWAAILGALERVGEAAGAATGTGASLLSDRTSAFIAALDTEALQRIISSGDASQRRRFAVHAASGLSSAASVRVVCAAAEALSHDIPSPVRAMLDRLSHQAQQDRDPARMTLDTDLREAVTSIVERWPVERKRPDAKPLASGQSDRPRLPVAHDQRPDGAVARSLSNFCQSDPLRFVQMALELRVGTEAVGEAADALAESGQSALLTDMVQAAPSSAATAILWRKLLAPQTVQHLLESRPLDLRTFDRLLPHLRGPALEVVFDSVATSDNRAIRRALLDRLLRLGPDIVKAAARRLEDDRWYVVRNMLMLIAELREIPPGLDLKRYLTHADARVRLEALRAVISIAPERDAALRHVLDVERDPRVLWFGLSSLRKNCPPWAVDPLLRLIQDSSVSDDLRAVAVRVLGRCPDPVALDVLLTLCESASRESVSGARTSAEALRALASTWPHEARARRALGHSSTGLAPRPGARARKSSRIA